VKNRFAALRRPHLWIIVLLFLLLIILHYPEHLPGLKNLGRFSLFGSERHALDRILFLIPTIYAAQVFGLSGGLVSLSVAFLIMLPRVIFVSHFVRDAGIETVLIVVIGGLVNAWLESRRRETGAVRNLEKSLRLYTDQIARAHEEERKRIARELHDDTIQTLTALSRRVDSMIARQPKHRDGSLETSLKTLKSIREEIDESLVRMRRFIQYLRPPILEYLGLLPALRELAAQVQQESGIVIRLQSEGKWQALAAEKELLLYRIIQEALRNVCKHSRADEASISVSAKSGELRLSVSDKGSGFHVGQMDDLVSGGRLGLVGMQERAHLVGASLAIDSRPGEGTTITVRLALPA